MRQDEHGRQVPELIAALMLGAVQNVMIPVEQGQKLVLGHLLGVVVHIAALEGGQQRCGTASFPRDVIAPGHRNFLVFAACVSYVMLIYTQCPVCQGRGRIESNEHNEQCCEQHIQTDSSFVSVAT